MAGYSYSSRGGQRYGSTAGAYRASSSGSSFERRSSDPARQVEKEAPLSVTEALAIAKGTLEGLRLTIEGEVSEVSAKSSYKAVYFTIKDRRSVLKCLMWKERYRAAGLELEVGQKVEVSGFFSLYAARGTMNFDVRRLSLAGEGKLRMEVAQLARKLEAEGLMDPARKRPIPAYPEVVGVVTSPHGDAVHDVLRTLRQRWPLARVVVAGVQVEGAGAASALIEGLRCVAASDAELVILCRGGGPYETMMPFNDERLARAIVACPIPVVTGIGHEPDNFIADMVADLRKSTPTFAAAGAAPDHAAVAQQLDACRTALDTVMRRTLDRADARVARLSDRPILRDATQLFAQEALGVDALASRLERALPATIERRRDAVGHLAVRLARVLDGAGEREGSALDRERARMRVALSGLLDRFERQMGLRAARLHDLSPLAILGRGYAIARDDEGSIVKCVEQAEPGDALQVSVSDGVIDCRVEGSRRIERDTVALE